MEFKLHSKYKPTGDQPQAIEQLVKGFKEGNQFETLLGVTGSGKTFTMANVIAALNKPTLIISHNKTLAGQLYGEMKEFFPENAVEYFVSYYDYYQPEAYVPQSDTYIAKDSSVNDEIDKLRLSATAALTERKDVIVVASVSCIYGLGSPDEWTGMSISLRPGQERDRDDLARALIDLQYTRNDMDFHRGTFRVHGDVLDIFPANADDTAIRVEFFGDVDDLLKTLGLYEHRHKLPNQLSGGQQQRTSIGRAIVKNPDILLCDEPTGALDYNTSKEILKLIEDVNQKYGNTIIMVTHNDAIKNMADRTVKLRDGMIRRNIVNENKISAVELDW